MSRSKITGLVQQMNLENKHNGAVVFISHIQNASAILSPTRQKEIFYQNKLGFPTTEGTEFKVDESKTKDHIFAFASDYKVDLFPVYFSTA